MKSIINKNDKGQLHGYQEWYWCGDLCYRRFYNNGIRVDYEERYRLNGNLENKNFHI